MRNLEVLIAYVSHHVVSATKENLTAIGEARSGEREQYETFAFIPLFKITILQEPTLCEGAFTELSVYDIDFCFFTLLW